MGPPPAGLAPDAKGVRPAVLFVVRGYRRALAAMGVTAFIGGFAEAMVLVAVTRCAFAITDETSRIEFLGSTELTVNQTLLVALGLLVVRIALAGAASWQSARLSTTIVARLRKRVASAFLDSAWEVQQAQRSGSLQELVTTFTNQASGLILSLNTGLVSAANLAALVVVAIVVDPVAALVLAVSVGVLSQLLRPLRVAVRRRARASAAAGLEFATSVSEVSVLGMELHVFHVQDGARARIGELVEYAREKARRMQFAVGLATPIYTGLAYLALLGALFVVAQSSSASLTSLGAAMLVMLRSLSYGQSVQGAYVGVSSSAPSIYELQRRMQVFEDARREDGGEAVGEIDVISADHVSFSYIPGVVVLRDVSFRFERREMVGIMGPSGGGKSTLVQLLLGLRDPDCGHILLDGRDLARFDKAELARKITFVPQAFHLIAGTVAENIRFFRDDVDQVAIEQAARLAHLHDDIVGFPDGYEHLVGEQGAHLSGGQQQRLCIARALVEQPDVMILDEPTSALDMRSEHLVRSTLLGLKKRMTVVVIAHRLSTVGLCDRIMVIGGGEILAFDAPADLEDSNDFYKEALTLSGLR